MVSVTLNSGFSNQVRSIVIDEETMRLLRDKRALKALFKGQARRKLLEHKFI
jgi:Zn/Cd-binding protein ZinT